MGVTIIVFTLLSEIQSIRDDIALPKMYNAQGNERHGDETARLCLTEDTTDFGLPGAESFEENLYYVQHAGSTADKRQQSEKLIQFAKSQNKKLFRHNRDFSHIPGDKVWDRIESICSPGQSPEEKQAALAALTKHIKESHFCGSLDEYVALVWLFANVTDGQERDWIENKIRKLSFNEKKSLEDINNFTEMRLKAEQLWLEHQGGGTIS